MDARRYLSTLVGKTIFTWTGQPNKVLAVDGDGVRVAGAKSQAGATGAIAWAKIGLDILAAKAGAMVPIAWVQAGLDLLETKGEVTIDAATLGHRSDFVGAVILSMPDIVRVESTPPKARRSR